jgi:hypothetical protein
MTTKMLRVLTTIADRGLLPTSHGHELVEAQDNGWITWSPGDLRYLLTPRGRYTLELNETWRTP